MAQAADSPWSNLLDRELISFGQVHITLGDTLLFVAILVATWLVSKLFRRSVSRIGSRSDETNAPAYYAVGRIGHYAIVVIGTVIALQMAGVNFASLAVAAGAIGIGIGIGLLFERSLKVGDFVELDNGLHGRVREINVRTTLITTNDNLDVVMLTNWTLNETIRRIHVPFGVAYGTDKEKVRTAVLEGAGRAAKSMGIDGLRDPEVWLVAFGDSALNFELVAWVGRSQVNSPGRTRAMFLWEIETSLAEHGIEIPFPQRDLHLRSGFEKLVQPAP